MLDSVTIKFLAVFMAFASWAGGGLINDHLLKIDPIGAMKVPFSSGKKVDTELARVLTFGHWPLYVESLWMSALQRIQFGILKEGQTAETFYLFDLATRLDRAFYEAHLDGASMLSVVKGDGRSAAELLERAENFRREVLPSMPEDFRDRFWQNNWRVPYLLGYVYLYDFRDISLAEDAFASLAKISEAPKSMRNVAKMMSTTEGQITLAYRLISPLRKIYKKNKLVMRSLEKKAIELQLFEYLYRINKEFKSYVGGKRVENWSYSFGRFLRERNRLPRGPLGGELTIDEEGKIHSSTFGGGAFQGRVFGMRY